MKTTQFLFLLVFMMFIFFSCEEEDIDYRDKYEGVYATNIITTTTFTDYDDALPPDEVNRDFHIKKSGTNQLTFTLNGVSETFVVDQEGNFSFPSEFKSRTYNNGLTLNLTISAFGIITERILYIKETSVGNAVLEVDGNRISENITQITIYNGVRK